jgi:hypothetical protein
MFAIITASKETPFLKPSESIVIDFGELTAARVLEIAQNLLGGGLMTHVGQVRAAKKKGDVEVTAKYGCTCFGPEIPDVPHGTARPVALSFSASLDAAEALVNGRLADAAVISVSDIDPSVPVEPPKPPPKP